MPERSSVVVGGLCLSLLLSAASASGAEVPEPELVVPAVAAILPGRTLAVLITEDIAATAERFEETNVHKLWAENEVQNFLRPVRDGFGGLYTKGEKILGFEYADLLSCFRGQAALALVDVGDADVRDAGAVEAGKRRPEIAFAAEVTDRPAAERLISRLARAIEELGGPAVQTWRFGTVTIGRAAREGEPLELAYVLTSRSLHVAVGPDCGLLSEMASAARGGVEAGNLAEDGDFRAALEEAGGRPDLFCYLAYARTWQRRRDVFPLIRDALRYARAPRQARRFIEAYGREEHDAYLVKLHSALGLDAVRSISFAEAVVLPGFRSQVYVHAPGPEAEPRTGVFELIPDEEISEELLELAPAGSHSLTAVRLRLDRLLPVARAVANAVGPITTQSLEQYISTPRDMGMDIEREVLNSLSGEALVFTAPVHAPGLGQMAGSVAGLSVVVPAAEREVFGGFCEKLFGLVDAFAVTAGVDIAQETTPEGAVLRYVGYWLGTTPTVTYFGDHLVAGTTKQAVGAVCAAIEKGVDEPLSASADFEKALDRATASSGRPRRPDRPPSPGFLLSYLPRAEKKDLAPLVAQVPMAKGAIWQWMSTRRAPKEIVGLVGAVDPAAAPSAETLASHADPQISVAWSDQDGVGLTCWTSTGVITPAIVTATVGAAVATPAIERYQQRAERRRCMAALRRVRSALTGYATDHGDGFPARLDDLVPGYLEDAADLACPGTGKRYAYVSGLRATDAPASIVVYELPEGHEGGLNVLNIDGSVMWRRNVAWVESRIEDHTRQLRAAGRKVQVIGGMNVAPPAVEDDGEEFF
jgi:hypothetical protein